jgi:transposase
VAALEPWLQEATNSGGPEFRHGAALEWPWSNGQGDGHLTRVKGLTRVGYGRAKRDLLRQRIWPGVVASARPTKDRGMDREQAVA